MGSDAEEEEGDGWRNAKSCCRKTVAFLFSHIGLTALVVAYSIMGAFLFQHLESQHEMDRMSVIRQWKNETVDAVWNITNDLQLRELYQNNCTTTCATHHNDTRARLQQQVRERNLLRAQQAKENVVSTLWNLTMDLNVLWKDNWTMVAEKEIDDLLQHIKTWTEEAESRPHKPEVKCSTLCTASSYLQNETKASWTDQVSGVVDVFQANISDAAQQGFDTGRSHPKWTFSSSFLYALSVITTIGYGHVTPKTTEGKVVTVLYAVIGIPIMLMFLANIGNFLAKIFIGLFAYLCRCRWLNTDDPVLVRHRPLSVASSDRSDKQTTPQKFFPADSSEKTSEEGGANVIVEQAWEPEVAALVRRLEKKDNNIPVVGCLVIMSAYLFGGATLFALWEGWPFLDAFYFCFVTLTTIGFGDFVPGASMLSSDTSNQKLVMCCIYVLVGLALIACCFNLMHNQVREYVKSLARFVGILKEKTIGGARRTIRNKKGKNPKRIPTVTLNEM